MDTNFSVGSKVRHESFGTGVIKQSEEFFYKIDFGVKGLIDITKSNDKLILCEEEEPESIDFDDIDEESFSKLENALINILEKYNGIQHKVELGDKWIGGTIVLKPNNSSLQSKEIPMDTFFHKIVMMRDRIRVLEQNINSNPKLNDEEKVNLQQYISRVYGSMTTFNVLFKNSKDFFSGK